MFIKPKISAQEKARLDALDSVRAKIMVADEDLTIIYMNQAVMGMMSKAEAELKRELPRFSMATLLGSNIDVFHKTPDHQRRMLAALREPHSATIRIGAWTFDLLVTPLMRDGQRQGFVVEWEDAHHRLQNVDYAAQIAAISRAQAVIAFQTDGTILDANETFLSLLGYTLEEIKGQHHRIFIEPAGVDEAYERFWEDLRSGHYRSAQFKRMTKSGKPVWIEGSYNPILDEKGRVTKVVKFATDVTAQVELLGKLKEYIEEIDAAVARSNAGAVSAWDSTGSAVADVKIVAESTEHLAASLQEIAGSMQRSRDATEGAFEQAEAVGRDMEALTAASLAMGGIVALIRSIASQINLLSLNATIEAARAGEAGKGFAVVASEVKSLAVQAAAATAKITAEIDGIQVTSDNVAKAITMIREQVTTVRDYVTRTASAVVEQTSSTDKASESANSAASAMGDAEKSVDEIVDAVKQVTAAVAKTMEAAQVLVR